MIYHGIYQYGGLVVFKENNKLQEIRKWLNEFQQKVNKAAVNWHLQFAA